MDILNQYHNEAGQIIQRTPDLSSREFYRDVMCRHKFDEMFVYAKERNKIGYYTTDKKQVILFGDGDSCTPPLEIGGSYYAPAYGFERIDDGRTVLYATEYGDSGSGGVWALSNCPLNFNGSGINIGFFVKSPDGYPPGNGNESYFMRLLSNDTATSYAYLWADSPPAVGAGIVDNDSFNAWQEWSEGYPTSLVDGSWNIFELQIRPDICSILLNGSTVKTVFSSNGFLSVINSTSKIVCGLYTHYQYTVDSHPQKSMSRLAYAYVEVVE